jgi:hypothetical protein
LGFFHISDMISQFNLGFFNDTENMDEK